MATFSEWLIFEDVRENVYEESLRRLCVQDALRKTFEFYNMAVSGRWSLILESSLEDEDDDGPVELDDPFASGDEDARPVWSAPQDDAEQEEDEEPEQKKNKKLDRKKKPSNSESLIFKAKTIKRYAQIVRWAAMLDRKDDIDKVRRIYTDELLPLLRKDDHTFYRGFRSLKENEEFEIPDFEDEDDQQAASNQSAPVASTAGSGPSAPSINPNVDMADVTSRLKPILIRLGYLKKQDLPDGMSQEKKYDIIARKAHAASKETGNDPPKSHPDVQKLIEDPTKRKDYSSVLMSAIEQTIRGTARKVYRQIRRLQGTVDGEKKYGSEGGFTEDGIVSNGVELIMKKLQTRRVNRKGVASEWNDDLTVLSVEVDSEDDASRIINNIKSPISTPERALRNDRREAKKASGLGPSSGAVFTCSACGHKRSVASKHVGTRMKCPKCQGEGVVQQGAGVVSHDAGSTAEDGSITSSDPADTRTTDSLTTAATAQTNMEIADVFRGAMKELAQSNPADATLACLWLGLHDGNHSDCANPNAPIGDGVIQKVISLLSGVNLSDRDRSTKALDAIGIQNISPNAGWGEKMKARWEFIKLLNAKKMPAVGVFALMPPGDVPPGWFPDYNKRHEFTPEQKSWYNFMNSVFDRLSKRPLKFIAEKMQEKLAERQAEIKPKGWQSPCSWSVDKFLKATFAPSLRSGSMTLQGDNPITITVYTAPTAKKRKSLRSYTIVATDQYVKISLVDGGEEKVSRSFAMPSLSEPCAKCKGSIKGCTECENCKGKVMDRLGFLKLEREINNILLTQIGTRAARRQA